MNYEQAVTEALLTGKPQVYTKEMAEEKGEAIYELYRAINNATLDEMFEACKTIDKEQLNKLNLIINSLLKN